MKTRLGLTLVVVLVVAAGVVSPALGLSGVSAATSLVKLGQLAGSGGNALAIQGNYAYIAAGDSGMRVVNVSNPASPTQVGLYNTPGSALDVAVAGSRAYVADGIGGLAVLNVADPTHPSLLGACTAPMSATAVSVLDSLAYVVDATGFLRVINVANPSTPTQLSAVNVLGIRPKCLVVVDGAAFVSSGSAFLRIATSNPSSPDAPIEVEYNPIDLAVASDGLLLDIRSGFLSVSTWNGWYPQNVGLWYPPASARLSGLAASGSYVYIGGDQLRVVDANIASDPQQIDTYATSGDVQAVEVSGTTVYILVRGAGLILLRHSPGTRTVTPTPTITRTPTVTPTPSITPTPGADNWVVGGIAVSAYGVAMQNDWLYMLSWGLTAVDVSDPLHPLMKGSCPYGEMDVAVSAQYAYVTDYEQFHVISLADPANPVRVGTLDRRFQTPNRVAVQGRYVYVAYTGMDQGVGVIDVLTPTHPISVGLMSTAASPADLALQGDRLFVLDADGLYVAGLANPVAPTRLGYVPIPGALIDLEVSGSRAYVCTLDALYVVDVEDPAHPQIVGSLPLRGVCLAESGPYLFLGGGQGVYALDITNGSLPVVMGHSLRPTGVIDMVTSGPYIYCVSECMGQSPCGLVVLRFEPPAPTATPTSTPTASATRTPTRTPAAGEESTPSATVTASATPRAMGLEKLSQLEGVGGNGLAVLGNNAYIASGAAGVRIVDVSDMSHPVQVGLFDTPGEAMAVAVEGTRAYVADGYGGILILDVTNPASPTLMGSWTLSVPFPWLRYRYTAISVAGVYLYAVGDRGAGATGELRVLNVADPAAPVSEGAGGVFDIMPFCLTVQGHWAVVANPTQLIVVDVTVPSTPVALTGLVCPNAASVAFDADKLFAQNAQGVTAYAVGSWDKLGSFPVASGGARGLAVSGGYVYAGGLSQQQLVAALSFSHPLHPSLIDSYSTPGAVTTDVVAEGSAVYVLSQERGLLILRHDANPWSPCMDCAAVANLPIHANGFALFGGYAYVAGDGLTAVDVSNPLSPTIAGQCQPNGLNTAYDVAVSGAYAFVAEEAGLWGMSLADPAQPVASWHLNRYDQAPRVVRVEGRYAYVAYTAADRGVAIFDVFTPTHPITMGLYSSAGLPSGMSVRGQYLYLSTSLGLDILSVADPLVPVQVGFYATSSSARDVLVDGSWAYLTTDDTLHILDIVDAAHPREVSAYPHGGALAIAGHYLYIGGGDGLRVLDISSQANPILVGRSLQPTWAIDLEVSGALVYQSNDDQGFESPHGLTIVRCNLPVATATPTATPTPTAMLTVTTTRTPTPTVTETLTATPSPSPTAMATATRLRQFLPAVSRR